MASLAELEMSPTLVCMFWLKRRKRREAKRTTKPMAGMIATNNKVRRQFRYSM